MSSVYLYNKNTQAMKRSVLIMLLLASSAAIIKAQQVADTAYKPQISNPA
jgi:hypothetical protein